MRIDFKRIWSKIKGDKKEIEKVLKVLDYTDTHNDVYLDFGNGNIKVDTNLKTLDNDPYRSSITLTSKNKTALQPNAITFLDNNKTFVVGDNESDLTLAKRKVDREYAKELIVYSIANLNVNNKANFKVSKDGIIDINLFMLLPENQMNDKIKFRNMLCSHSHRVEINGVTKEYRIHLIEVFEESKMALMALGKAKMMTFKPLKAVLDLGMGTQDSTAWDRNNNVIDNKSYGTSMRDITPLYMDIESLDIDNLTAMERALEYGMEFSKDELIQKHEIESKWLNKELKTLDVKIFSKLVRGKTTILCIGGGAITLKESLKNYFKKYDYDVEFLSNDNAIKANLIGLKNYVKENRKTIIGAYANELKITKKAQSTDKKVAQPSIKTNAQPSKTSKKTKEETNAQSRINKINLMIKSKEFFELGMKNKEIAQAMNEKYDAKLKEGTIKNYRTLLKKIDKYNEMVMMQIDENEIMNEINADERTLQFIKEFNEYEKALVESIA